MILKKILNACGNVLGDEVLFITLVINITSLGRLCVELFFKRVPYTFYMNCNWAISLPCES